MYNFLIIRNGKKYLNEYEPQEGREMVLMLRGLSRSYKGWLGAEEEMSKEFDVLCIDLPGVSLSKNEKHLYNIKDIAKEMNTVLEFLDLKRYFIVGPSLGSLVAYELIKMMPLNKVAGLIVVVPSHTGLGLKRLTPLAVNTMLSSSFVSPEKKMKNLKSMLIGKTSSGNDPFEDKEWEEKWKHQILEDTKELGSKGQIAQMSAGAKYTSKSGLDYIKNNQIPTLFLMATNDAMIPRDHAYKVYDYIRHQNSEISELQNCGHDFITSHKKELIEEINGFVKNISKFERPVTVSSQKQLKVPKPLNKTFVVAGLLTLGFIMKLIFKRKDN